MSRILAPTIPATDDVAELRLSMANAINNLVNQINNKVIDDNMSVNNKRITNVATPASMTDAANKQYVDSKVFGGNSSGVIAGGSVSPANGPGTAQFPTNIVTDGDSLTVGYPGGVPNSYPGQLAERLGQEVTNIGVDGATTADVIATHIAQADALYDPNMKNFYILGIGTNDLLNSVGTSTVQTNIASIITGRRAVGYTVIVLTITPSNYATAPGGYQAARTVINNWLAAGSTTADLVCDVGSDPFISDPNDTTFYTGDKLHMTTAGYAVVAINVTAAVQRINGSAWGYQPIDPFGTRLSGSYARDPSYKDFVNVYDFGALSTASAAINTTAITNAIAAAATLGLPVVFPEAAYTINKLNVYTASSTKPVVLISRAYNAGHYGTELTCTGSGTSWLLAAVNAVIPNGSNTAANFSGSAIPGLYFKGLYIKQVHGTGNGISGFWLANQTRFVVEDCGVVAPTGGDQFRCGIETWACTVSDIVRFTADVCSVGIALNGAVADTTLGGVSKYINVIDPLCHGCLNAGISFQFTNWSNVYGGFMSTNAVGVYGNGVGNNVHGLSFTGNTVDVDMLTATAPYGGSVAPNFSYFEACEFTGPVRFKDVDSGVIAFNKFDTGATLSIDSNCTLTRIDQHNSFPATFTDAGANTYGNSYVQAAGAPTGSIGVKGQIYRNTTTGDLWMCTTGGAAGTAVWTIFPGSAVSSVTASGSGITASPTTGAVIVANTGVTSNVAGAGISVSGATGAVTVAQSWGTWTGYTPTVATGGAGTSTGSNKTAAYLLAGKLVYVRMYASVAQTVADTTNFLFSLPVAPKNTASGYQTQSLAVSCLNGGLGIACVGVVIDVGNFGVAPGNGANFLNGQTYVIAITGVYEAA